MNFLNKKVTVSRQTEKDLTVTLAAAGVFFFTTRLPILIAGAVLYAVARAPGIGG